MHKHCGSLSFKRPSLKIAPFFFFFPTVFFFSFSFPQSAERDGRLDMMLQFLSWNSLCETMDQLLVHC